MKIPDKVRIGGVDYTVGYEERLMDDDGQGLCGQISYRNGTIKLDPNVQDEQGKKQTLLHEILHGIAEHFDLPVRTDEDTIDKLAKGLYMVIVDNPGMFESND